MRQYCEFVIDHLHPTKKKRKKKEKKKGGTGIFTMLENSIK
jgi:hypothetical protein